MIKNIFKGFRKVDLVALAIFLGIMVLAYFFMLRKAEYINIVLRVSQSDLINANTGGVSATLPAWYLENLKTDMDNSNKSNISIVKVFEYQNNSNEKIVYLTLRLLTVYDKKSRTYNYEGLPLLVGSYQNFRYKGVLLRGIIQKVGVLEEEREEKTFLVEGILETNPIGSKDWGTTCYPVGGDKVFTEFLYPGLTISDSDDRVMVKVEEVKTSPSYVKLLSGGKLVKVEDRDNKMVKVKLRVRVEKFDDVYLYAGETTIKIGSYLDLDFWDFNVSVRVTDFQEVQ
jgi:hypothetical protein